MVSQRQVILPFSMCTQLSCHLRLLQNWLTGQCWDSYHYLPLDTRCKSTTASKFDFYFFPWRTKGYKNCLSAMNSQETRQYEWNNNIQTLSNRQYRPVILRKGKKVDLYSFLRWLSEAFSRSQWGRGSPTLHRSGKNLCCHQPE